MLRIFYGWWIVIASFLIAFYVGGVTFGFTAFFEPIVAEFGWSYIQVSIAFSLPGLEIGILAPAMGILVDRVGSRKLIFSGALTAGFALILFSLTNSLFIFYSALVLLGLGVAGCETTVLTTAVANWFKRNVGKGIGIISCGFAAGGILIPFIVWLIYLYSWRTALIILGSGIMALGIPLSFVFRHRPEPYGYLPDGEISAEPSSSHGKGYMEEINFKGAIKNTSFWKIGLAEVIRMMIVKAVIIHVMPYLSSIGMPRSSAVFVATSIPLFSVIGRLSSGWLSDIFDKRYVLACLYGLLGIGTFLFAYVHVQLLVLPFLIFFAVAFGGTVPLRGAILMEYFGTPSFGKLLGIIMGMAEIGGFIGPLVAGWTYDNLGSYQPIWLSFAGITIIAIISILRIGTDLGLTKKKRVIGSGGSERRCPS